MFIHMPNYCCRNVSKAQLEGLHILSSERWRTSNISCGEGLHEHTFQEHSVYYMMVKGPGHGLHISLSRETYSQSNPREFQARAHYF